MMEQKPSVGRIVLWFFGNDTEPTAAIVTKVNVDGTVELTCFAPGDLDIEPVSNCPYSETPLKGDRWCWPPRV